MVSLKRYVCESGDEFVEPQSIIKKDYNEFDSDPELIQRFRCICSNIFTYVDIRNDKIITSQTYKLFSKYTPRKICFRYIAESSGWEVYQ